MSCTSEGARSTKYTRTDEILSVGRRFVNDIQEEAVVMLLRIYTASTFRILRYPRTTSSYVVLQHWRSVYVAYWWRGEVVGIAYHVMAATQLLRRARAGKPRKSPRSPCTYTSVWLWVMHSPLTRTRSATYIPDFEKCLQRLGVSKRSWKTRRRITRTRCN